MEVYIDGACKNNGKPLARASYGIYWENDSPNNCSDLIPETEKQTNNTGELFAAIQCLRQIQSLNISSVTVKSDSEYLTRGITQDIHYWASNNWRLKSTGNPVKHVQLWQTISSLCDNSDIQWIHVKRDSEPGQIQADILAKNALNLKTSKSTGRKQCAKSDNDVNVECTVSETVPKYVTPVRHLCRKSPLSPKTSNYNVINAVRRLETLLLTIQSDVSELNENLTEHIEETNRHFCDMNDRIYAVKSGVKLHCDTVLSSIQHINVTTKSMQTDFDTTTKDIANKVQSLSDRVRSSKYSDVLKVSSSELGTPAADVSQDCNTMRNTEGSKPQQNQRPSNDISSTRLGKNSSSRFYVHSLQSYGNDDISQRDSRYPEGEQFGGRRRSSTGMVVRERLGRHGGYMGPRNHGYENGGRQRDHSASSNASITDPKHVYYVGSSILKKMSPNKMSTEAVNVRVKTLRGARIKDVEQNLAENIGKRSLQHIDIVAVQAGTNNISDGDSVQDIVQDFSDLIETVTQGLPHADILISSILPRPHDRKANNIIDKTNRQLKSLQNDRVTFLDNTMDFYARGFPSTELYMDHVHINVSGTKILSQNITGTVSNMLDMNENFQMERPHGRRISRNTKRQIWHQDSRY